MRGVLRVGRGVWSATLAHLLGCRQERMAYLLARASSWTSVAGEPTLDLLVVRALPVPDAALSVQSPVRVVVEPSFTKAVLIGCYEAGLSLVDVHTHPFATDRVAFSGHDEGNMRDTHSEFLRLLPANPPVAVASLVIGQSSVAGRFSAATEAAPRPLDGFTILGDCAEEVPLCR